MVWFCANKRYLIELFFESELEIPYVEKQWHDIENENLLLMENANEHMETILKNVNLIKMAMEIIGGTNYWSDATYKKIQ